ncbi:MAG: S41 family peptidase [Prevotellaceae bacterium]|jgi:hypothetical protein|nr:S41 family peptidase [Prevotellaceae bacterium]
MKKILFSFFLLFIFSSTYSQQVSGDTLVADFKYLVKALEETHPDPYTGFGGKVFFHKKAFEVEQSLKKGGTLNDFSETILSFFSNLEDGHTYLEQINFTKSYIPNLVLPIEFSVISDGLIISGISKENEHLIGAQLVSVNGIAVADLLERVGRSISTENIYGRYATLSGYIRQFDKMKRLIPELEETTSIKLKNLSGEIKHVQITFLSKDNMASIVMVNVPAWDKIQDGYMSYNYLDKNNQAMYFRLSSVMAKESFSYVKEQGWPNTESWLKSFYKSTLKAEMPENIDEAIDKLLNVAEVFRKMLEEMKKNNSEVLVIDLRGNGGGFTGIVLPTLYMMYGDDYLKKNMGTENYMLVSPLLIKKFVTTLDEFNKLRNASYEYGDYTFFSSKSEDKPIEDKRAAFINNTLGEGARFVEDLDGKPLYQPSKVFVITDGWTFSAAFHYAFYLWKMEAAVVGTPCMQAPNTYMATTPFELPLTKLKGSISNSFQVFLPADDRRAKVFYPDIMLSWKDYSKYNFDKHSDVLFLLVDVLNLDL